MQEHSSCNVYAMNCMCNWVLCVNEEEYRALPQLRTLETRIQEQGYVSLFSLHQKATLEAQEASRIVFDMTFL